MPKHYKNNEDGNEGKGTSLLLLLLLMLLLMNIMMIIHTPMIIISIVVSTTGEQEKMGGYKLFRNVVVSNKVITILVVFFCFCFSLHAHNVILCVVNDIPHDLQ